jgi:drug/metabolite transporter (DMT)-like permease
MIKTKAILLSLLSSSIMTIITKYIVNYYSSMHEPLFNLFDLAISGIPPVLFLLFDRKLSNWSVLRIAAMYATAITIVGYYF